MRTLAVLLLALLLAGCAQQQSQAPRVDLAAETAKLRETDAAWLAAIAAKDVERAAAFWADDAHIYPPGQPPVIGKPAIREYVARAFADPNFSVTWKTVRLEPAASGEMAYQLADDRFTFTGGGGKKMVLDGRAVAIWRKQPDGAWKCVIDIWNQ
jgi:uncharacterized protein (TIGR02246 family)